MPGEGAAPKSKWQDEIRNPLPHFIELVDVPRCAMGILTRKQDERFVISSDHTSPGVTSKRAPRRLNEPYQVWTGFNWSPNTTEAVVFDSLEDADEYVRANYPKLVDTLQAT